MEALIAIIVGLIIVAILKLHEKKGTASIETAQDETAYEPKLVRDILADCRKDLDDQHVAGCGPWIASLLDGGYEMEVTGYDRHGLPMVERAWTECSAAEALTAVRWTIRELAGGRFRTDKLQEAAALLEAITE